MLTRDLFVVANLLVIGENRHSAVSTANICRVTHQ